MKKITTKASHNTPNENDKRFWHKNTENNNSEMLIIENAKNANKNGINRSKLYAMKKEKCEKLMGITGKTHPIQLLGGKVERKKNEKLVSRF